MVKGFWAGFAAQRWASLGRSGEIVCWLGESVHAKTRLQQNGGVSIKSPLSISRSFNRSIFVPQQPCLCLIETRRTKAGATSSTRSRTRSLPTHQGFHQVRFAQVIKRSGLRHPYYGNCSRL